MRIQHDGRSEAAGYSERARRTSSTDAGQSPQGTRTRQVGLDRVDVSEVAEAAYRAVSITSGQREERVATLANQVQGGEYSLDMSSLSESILDFDSEPDYQI